MTNLKSKLVIAGVNKSGEIFRPSDWAQRLSSFGADFGADQRLQFSPFLRPDLRSGVVCLVVDPKLCEVKPDLYKYVIDFAESNDLMTHLAEVA